jgi:hypothetical protein
MNRPANRPSNWLRPIALVLGIAVVGLAVVIVGLRILRPIPTPPEGVQLTDLEDLDQLAARFNEDRDLTRLVLVLAPT